MKRQISLICPGWHTKSARTKSEQSTLCSLLVHWIFTRQNLRHSFRQQFVLSQQTSICTHWWSILEEQRHRLKSRITANKHQGSESLFDLSLPWTLWQINNRDRTNLKHWQQDSVIYSWWTWKWYNNMGHLQISSTCLCLWSAQGQNYTYNPVIIG